MVDYGPVTRILLLRHGQSTWNAEGRWQGWADPPLTPRGEADAAQAAATIATGRHKAARSLQDRDGDEEIEVVVSSDLERARRTAVIIAERLTLGAVESYPGLREREVGQFTGLTRLQIDERWPGLLVPDAPLDPPGGESAEALVARTVATLHRLEEVHPGQRVLALTHGALIRALESHLGVAHGPTPNLSGRWVAVSGGSLTAGDRAALLPGDTAALSS